MENSLAMRPYLPADNRRTIKIAADDADRLKAMAKDAGIPMWLVVRQALAAASQEQGLANEGAA